MYPWKRKYAHPRLRIEYYTCFIAITIKVYLQAARENGKADSVCVCVCMCAYVRAPVPAVTAQRLQCDEN